MTNPVRTAAAFIPDDDGRVLFIRENYDRRRYGPPGGLVEPGESPSEAVIREVYEETTLEVEVQHLIGVYFFPDVPVPFLAFAFRCKVVDGKPTVPSTGEIAAIDWFDPARLPAPLTYLAPRAMPDFVAGRRNLLRTIREERQPPT